MQSTFIKYIPVLLVLLITVLFAKLYINKRAVAGKDNCYNISGDARGYYAWLPAIFIYKDLNFYFRDSVENKDPTCCCLNDIPIQEYRNTFNGLPCNKYYPGASFLMLPFFAIAHFYTAYFTDLPANGYTFYYFRIMAFSAMFYYMLGMLFFLKVLDKMSLGIKQKLLSIIFLTLGSNIIYYVVDAPLYSHIYSFFLTAAFIYFVFSLKNGYSILRISCASFLLGLIFITRPVNISVLLVVPFILGNDLLAIGRCCIKGFRPLAVLPALIMPLILFALYKFATGCFFVYSYASEGFNFLHPHFWQFLFHYDNGLFLYMPMLLMPFVFITTWYNKESKRLVIGIITTLAITAYIHSSWWCWNYSFSFGARTMLDFLPLFGIMIGISIKNVAKNEFPYLVTAYTFCCVITMVLYHQKSANHYMGVYPITDYWKALFNAFGAISPF